MPPWHRKLNFFFLGPPLPGGERDRSGAQEGSQPPVQAFSARKFRPAGKSRKIGGLAEARAERAAVSPGTARPSRQLSGKAARPSVAQSATIQPMAASITQRELRNDSGEILRRLDQGESFVVTRNGVPVGELIPLRRRQFVPAAAVVAIFRNAPAIDPDRFRADVDAWADQAAQGRHRPGSGRCSTGGRLRSP